MVESSLRNGLMQQTLKIKIIEKSNIHLFHK